MGNQYRNVMPFNQGIFKITLGEKKKRKKREGLIARAIFGTWEVEIHF